MVRGASCHARLALSTDAAASLPPTARRATASRPTSAHAWWPPRACATAGQARMPRRRTQGGQAGEPSMPNVCKRAAPCVVTAAPRASAARRPRPPLLPTTTAPRHAVDAPPDAPSGATTAIRRHDDGAHAHRLRAKRHPRSARRLRVPAGGVRRSRPRASRSMPLHSHGVESVHHRVPGRLLAAGRHNLTRPSTRFRTS